MGREDSSRWEELFDPKEIGEIQNKLDKIVYHSENGFNISMNWSIDQCITFVANYHWSFHNTAEGEDAANYINEFVEYFANFLEDWLESEGIDWQEELD